MIVPAVATETCIIHGPVKTEALSAVCRPQTHLVTDQIPLLVVVVLAENLHFVWREIHRALKQRIPEVKFLLTRIQISKKVLV